MTHTIYKFGFGDIAGGMDDKVLLGSKGANLAEMSKLGIDVPMGITIPTTVCQDYRALPKGKRSGFVIDLVDSWVLPALAEIEELLGYMPLFSVRSGAADSMPGMMDTILNVGLTTKNMGEWAERIGQLPTYDCRRRLLQMFATTVEGHEGYLLKKWWKEAPTKKYGGSAPGTHSAVLKSEPHMAKLVEMSEKWYAKYVPEGMPTDLRVQLIKAVEAVFKSWDSERAIEYRTMHGLDHDMGTAVNIQMMVFGNLNPESCSGVAFTRDYADGTPEMTGDFLVFAQGEDVVAGTANTQTLDELEAWNADIANELLMICEKLETHYRDMMDLEFTVESGKLWMLQCRVGKRSAKAAFRIAHDLAEEELITRAEAVSRVTYKQYMALKKVRIDLPADQIPAPDFTGIAAGGGLVVGEVVTSSEAAKMYGIGGKDWPVILVTDETTPEDFGGMAASVGILTRTGGATSHAAVVGRSLEKHCVVGCTDLPQDIAGEITIDGSTGRVWLQKLPLSKGGQDEISQKIVNWAIAEKSDIFVKAMPSDSLPARSYVMAGLLDDGDFVNFIQTAHTIEGIEEMFIDLSTEAEHKLDADLPLWNICGDTGHNIHEVGEVNHRVKLLLTLDKQPIQAKAALVLSKHSKAIHYVNLRAAGWTVVRTVKNLNDLLESDGIVDIHEDFAASIGGPEVAEKLFGLMLDAGRQVRPKPVPVSKSRLVAEALK